MAKLTVAESQDRFLLDGRPFFYLADTAWAAFANLSLDEWTRYLKVRRMQGFNALQISILPVTHDQSMSEANTDPFLADEDGDWDFSALNPAYFDKAETMIEMAVEQGFLPVLGMLWCSYVPGTRCSEGSPVASAMPLEAVKAYARNAAARFKRFDPAFFISGDTCFESPEEAPYYMAALQIVREICPDALLTMHLHPQGDLPPEFIEAVDFYMFQSGHGATSQDNHYRHAERFAAYPIKRPVINSEPCYEGHGRVGERTRFSAFDVREATWQSLLSGAKAGVTYGGHGVWSFHRRGMNFLNADRSFEPFDWEQALLLDGAWDVSFAKWIFETYDLVDLDPSEMLRNDDPEIRAATDATQSKIAVYSPYSFDLELNVDLSGYDCVQIDLSNRRILTPDVVAGAASRVYMPPVNGDSLFLAIKR